MRIPALMLVMLLAGCATAPDFASTSAPARDCEELARTIRAPDYTDDEDFRIIAEQYKRKLDAANWHLSATRKCQADVRQAAEGGR